jgi:hypothetical protein
VDPIYVDFAVFGQGKLVELTLFVIPSISGIQEENLTPILIKKNGLCTKNGFIERFFLLVYESIPNYLLFLKLKHKFV